VTIAGRDAARWNGCDVIAPQNLPITKGLQEQIRHVGGLDVADEVRAMLCGSLRRPHDDVPFGEIAEDTLADVFGGFAVPLVQALRIRDADVRNLSGRHWDRAFALFRLTV
jgi:hypothetical protein